MAEEQRVAPALLPLDSPADASRCDGVRAQHRGVGGEKVKTVEVGALRSGDCLVDVESGRKALTRPILRLDAVLVKQSKGTCHDHNHVRPGVGMPTGRLAGCKMEALKHSVGTVRLIALVNASTDITFSGVPPARVPSGTAAGGTLVEGSSAYATVVPMPSAITAAARPVRVLRLKLLMGILLVLK